MWIEIKNESDKYVDKDLIGFFWISNMSKKAFTVFSDHTESISIDPLNNKDADEMHYLAKGTIKMSPIVKPEFNEDEMRFIFSSFTSQRHLYQVTCQSKFILKFNLSTCDVICEHV